MNNYHKLEKLTWDIKRYQSRLENYNGDNISIKKVIADLELIMGGTNLC
jgi:hypothetical protein